MLWFDFQHCTKWKVGRGNRIKFWEDRWAGDGSLMSRIPRIFNIAQYKSLTVGESYQFINGRAVWAINVQRNMNNWEVAEYDGLLQALEVHRVSTSDDRIVWKLENNGTFSVSSYYKHLCHRDAAGSSDFLAKLIWRTKVPPAFLFSHGMLVGKEY